MVIEFESTIQNTLIICREVNRQTGEIIIYPLKTLEISESLIWRLHIRAKYNPELKYFAMQRTHWEDDYWRNRITKALVTRIITCKTMVKLGLFEI